MRTRTRRWIGAPTAPNIRRSWRFQPWVSVARYQVRSGDGSRSQQLAQAAASRWRSSAGERRAWPAPRRAGSPPGAPRPARSSSGAPSPMAYSRSTPWRGWSTRSAHSPSLVSSSIPSESWSSRPTGYSRAPSGTSAVGMNSSTVCAGVPVLGRRGDAGRLVEQQVRHRGGAADDVAVDRDDHPIRVDLRTDRRAACRRRSPGRRRSSIRRPGGRRRRPRRAPSGAVRSPSGFDSVIVPADRRL